VLDPYLGRWTTRDTSEYADGLNVYLAMRGSPVVLTDPMGLTTYEPGNCSMPLYGPEEPSTGGGGGCPGGCYFFPSTIQEPPPAPPPGPTEKEKCCEEAEENGLNAGRGAGVVCCKGKKYSCNFKHFSPTEDPDGEIERIVEECHERHEDTHHEQTLECDPEKKEPYLPKFKKGYGKGWLNYKVESEAYKASSRCFDELIGQCKTSQCVARIQNIKAQHEAYKEQLIKMMNQLVNDLE
jgi:hypothetical protein